MDNMLPYLLLSLVIVVCAMPAVIWWVIKYIPIIIMSYSKVFCIILFFIIIGFFGAYDSTTEDSNDIDISKAGKAIVVEDDER
tara:strand:- start:322 stop:570 length:249 start_codon:yes stop_codon:yes gene_type:complete